MLVESDEKARRCTTMSVTKTPSKLENGVLVRDFVTKDVTTYEMDAPKDADFRLDMSYHDLDRDKIIRSALTVELFGVNGTSKQHLHDFFIYNLDNRSTIIADVVFPKALFSQYTKLSLQLTCSQSLLLITMTPYHAKVHDIDVGEISLFTLRKGDTLNYRL